MTLLSQQIQNSLDKKFDRKKKPFLKTKKKSQTFPQQMALSELLN